MKKTIAFVLVLVIILSLAACGAVKEVQESKSLYAHGLEVVSMLSEMTRSESFIGIYTANSKIKEIILALGDHSYETPDAVYAITVPEDTLMGMPRAPRQGAPARRWSLRPRRSPHRSSSRRYRAHSCPDG